MKTFSATCTLRRIALATRRSQERDEWDIEKKRFANRHFSYSISEPGSLLAPGALRGAPAFLDAAARFALRRHDDLGLSGQLQLDGARVQFPDGRQKQVFQSFHLFRLQDDRMLSRRSEAGEMGRAGRARFHFVHRPQQRPGASA